MRHAACAAVWLCLLGSLPFESPLFSLSQFMLKESLMTVPALLAGSVLALVLTLALVREVRLRRALETLLRRLLEKWRSRRED